MREKITFNAFLVSVYLVINFIPFLYRSLSMVSLAIIVAIVLLNFNSLLKKPYIYMLLLSVILTTWELLLLFIGISNTEYGYIFYSFRFFTSSLVLFPIIPKLTNLDKKMLLISWFLSFSFTIMHNFYLYLTMGDAYYNFQTDASLANYNIADTYYGIAVVLCLFISLIVLLNRKKYSFLLNIIMVFTMILSILFIIIANRLTTIIISVIGFILIIIYNRARGKHVKYITIFVLTVLAFLVFTDVGADILEKMLSFDFSDRIKDRIESIIFALRTGDFVNSKSSLSGRFIYTINSWNTWTNSFSSILFGVGDQRDNLELIGNHSYFIDTLARFGIFYMLLLITFLYLCHKELIRNVNNDSLKAQCGIILFIFIFRNFIGNSIYVVVGMVLYVVIPLILSMKKEYACEKNEETLINGVVI